MIAVVDENVAIVANDATRINSGLPPIAEQAGNECRLAAVRYLRSLITSGEVVVDDAGACFGKYARHLSRRGQPGIGDAFLRHILENAHNSDRVERVTLAVEDDEFVAFPKHEALQTFDEDDRIWIALALASDRDPEVANAVDSDYRQHRQALLDAGVKVVEVCAGTTATNGIRQPGRVRRTRQRS